MIDDMFFRQLYLGCLAQASYLIGSDGEAAVVDPRRDVDEYIAAARDEGLTIRYVIETHLHADFVSGHGELAARTGASIVIGSDANAEFPHLPVGDGDVLPLGSLNLRILGTPGHTPESICILIEEGSRPVKVLTGDTLFIGDVGRPDLAGGAGFTPAEMAALLYDSLHGKLLTLADEVEVWPAHGAGSLCGRNMSKETSSTIGLQRRMNYALRPMSKDEFVAMMTAEMVEAPGYFFRDAQINRRGAVPLGDIPAPKPVSPREAAGALERGAIVLDVRTPGEFGAGHVPHSLNVGLGGQYASWAGTLIESDAEVLLVTDGDDRVEEAAMRLARVGLENAQAYLSGGIVSWCDAGLPLTTVAQISVGELRTMMEAVPALQVIDVRRPGEYRDGHVPGAVNIPLHELPAAGAQLDATRPAAVICASGYRSSIGTSVLERLGFTELYNVTGGTNAWLVSGLPAERAA
ncbi:MAG TPA: MBL fold metallo-hydrolase [Thermoanaerobaculia bacterium]|nr:MBL fold metallo-hydrolase [Thermoanaerobaculia bacterium]